MSDTETRQGVWVSDIAAVDPVNRFRRARFQRFRKVLEAAARDAAKDGGSRAVRVLDLGGAPGFWRALESEWRDLPLEITIANLGAPDEDDPPFFLRGGNACAMDAADNSFDVVHSNSVIEHVGGWRAMQDMAREVRRLAPRYFVQTPNFWFPYEPHYHTPLMHWLPETVRAALVTRWPRGWIHAASFDDAMMEVQAISLLSARQLAALFPDARIERERFAGLTKSLLAIR